MCPSVRDVWSYNLHPYPGTAGFSRPNRVNCSHLATELWRIMVGGEKAEVSQYFFTPYYYYTPQQDLKVILIVPGSCLSALQEPRKDTLFPEKCWGEKRIVQNLSPTLSPIHGASSFYVLSCHFSSSFSQHTQHNITALHCPGEVQSSQSLYIGLDVLHPPFYFWVVSRAEFQRMSLNLCWLASLEGCCVFHFLSNSPTPPPFFSPLFTSPRTLIRY